MKKSVQLKHYATLILIILFMAANTICLASSTNDTIVLPTNSDPLYINGTNWNLNGGDSIYLTAGQYQSIDIDGVFGDSLKPVVLCNLNGIVEIGSSDQYGIRIRNCKHLLIKGIKNSDSYGILINDVATHGITEEQLSSNIEIDGIEIGNTGLAGIMAKSDPNCSFNSLRDSFCMYDTKIHDCYIHHTGMEGMYIGYTFYSGKTIECNGRDTTILPHLMDGVYIYRNILEYNDLDGIQVSSASNNCSIYENYIYNDSYAMQYGQMSGIIIGDGTMADCYNNIILDGKGMGIEVHGLGNTKVFNNLIINAGIGYHNDEHGAYSKHGIFVGYQLINPSLSPYIICNNTIIHPKSEGISFNNINGRNSLIYNNAIVKPGIWSYYESNNIPTSRAFIHFGIDGIECDTSNNYFSRYSSGMNFADTSMNDYQPLIGSPLINSGASLSTNTPNFDLNYAQRPYAQWYDIGAYECQDASLLSISENNQNPFLNFRYTKDEINCTFRTPLYVNFVSIYSINNKLIVRKEVRKSTSSFSATIQFPNSGLYIIVFDCQGIKFAKTVIIL